MNRRLKTAAVRVCEVMVALTLLTVLLYDLPDAGPATPATQAARVVDMLPVDATAGQSHVALGQGQAPGQDEVARRLTVRSRRLLPAAEGKTSDACIRHSSCVFFLSREFTKD